MSHDHRPETLFDTLIIGAGLSGIGAACHLKRAFPDHKLCILEKRDRIGGTWDLFKYPGIRSDSDMYTLGYGFRPWMCAKTITDGPSIRAYIEETAAQESITEHIEFSHAVTKLAWSDNNNFWTITAQSSLGEKVFRARFVMMCSGYYSYDKPYQPEFPNQSDFQGPIIHPQLWDESLDYTDQTILIIGSGATAMTLAPAMAESAKKVILLQRSPTYVVSQPARDSLAPALQRIMPTRWAHQLARLCAIQKQSLTYKLMRKFPGFGKKRILGLAEKELDDKMVLEHHLTPKYPPWDQRICIVPDADLFRAINAGKVVMKTDIIACLVRDGIKTQSGETIKADVIITATGLNMVIGEGIDIFVNGEAKNFADTIAYKGTMFSGLPNLVAVFGYINASWTLRSDLIAKYVVRLQKFMRQRGYQKCVPIPSYTMQTGPYLSNFTAGYVERAALHLPKQGTRPPWQFKQDYGFDKKALLRCPLEDGEMRYM